MLPNQRQNQSFRVALPSLRPGLLFIGIILCALVAFEIFNYSTTDHALNDLLGDLTFFGMPWSTILALAFCGIDFAGIARLFTPEVGMHEPKEVWYLFGAWLLAATMNAILTWWGVSLAISGHTAQSSLIIDRATIAGVVPVFVAVMVWVIRILIIGTLSQALDRMLHPGAEQRVSMPAGAAQTTATSRINRQQAPIGRPMSIPQSLGSAAIPPRPTPAMPRSGAQVQSNARSASRFSSAADDADTVYGQTAFARPEPTYHSLTSSARTDANNPPVSSNRNTGNDRYRRS